MKRVMSLVIAFLLVFALSGCQKQISDIQDQSVSSTQEPVKDELKEKITDTEKVPEENTDIQNESADTSEKKEKKIRLCIRMMS